MVQGPQTPGFRCEVSAQHSMDLVVVHKREDLDAVVAEVEGGERLVSLQVRKEVGMEELGVLVVHRVGGTSPSPVSSVILLPLPSWDWVGV